MVLWGSNLRHGSPGIESTHFEYNSDGRLQTILQGSRATTFEYDTSTGPTRGTLLRTIDALNQTTEYTSDALGRLTSVKAP
jgi:YD repeat-containing protein